MTFLMIISAGVKETVWETETAQVTLGATSPKA